MLYVTTRNDGDAYTSDRAMIGDTAPDGGQFLPKTIPAFGRDVLNAVSNRSFSENVAWVLGQLWGKPLTSWDIDSRIGRLPVEVREVTSRMMAAEIWHSEDLSVEELSERLFRVVVTDPLETPGQWFTMSLRIALIFAVFAKLTAVGLVSPDKPLDVAVPSMDFQYPMALWYARNWGLPVGRIICACNENNAPWTLLHQGEMRTDAPLRRTYTAACDQVTPSGLERLIHATLGRDEVQRYVGMMAKRRMYTINSAQQHKLRAGLSVCVVSQRRMEFMIPNLFRPGLWTPNPYTAMAFAALVDHRAHSGDTGRALVLSEEHPVFSAQMLSKVMGISPDEVRAMVCAE